MKRLLPVIALCFMFVGTIYAAIDNPVYTTNLSLPYGVVTPAQVADGTYSNMTIPSAKISAGALTVSTLTLTAITGNTLIVGTTQFSVNQSSTIIGGHLVCAGLSPAGAGTALVISATNEVYPLTSSRRFKENIVDLKVNSDSILGLKIYEFDYNKSKDHSIGIMAEDSFAILPQIVNKDSSGKPYSIRYDQLQMLMLDKIIKQQMQINALMQRVNKLELK